MINRIHFQNRYLSLDKAKYERINELNSAKRKMYSVPIFLPVKIGRPDILDTTHDIRVVTFNKEHIDYLDVLHTLAYLESNIRGRNVLTSEQQFGRFGWSVIEKSNGIEVYIDKKLLHLIQYGFGCKITCYEKTRKHLYYVPQYAFIVRAWMDVDKRVFKHALHSLTNILRRRLTYAPNDCLDIIRQLPNLLEKFGSQWENELVKDYNNDHSPFLMCLLCLLCPCGNLDNLYITEEGMSILGSPFAPPAIKNIYAERELHKCNDGSYKLVSNNDGNCWKAFYKWIMSTSCPPKQSFRLFLSGSRKINTLYKIGKKRDFVTMNRTKLKTKDLTKELYHGGYFNIHGKQIVKTNMLHLAKLIALCEMRKDYRSFRWQGRGYTPEEYTNMAGNDNLMPYIEDLLRTGTKIEPLVQLPKGIKSDDGKCDIHVVDSFPILKFSKKYKEELDTIIGVNKYKYF